VERIHRQEKRKKLQERLKDTRALWNARQADLEQALATHKDTAEVAQHDMQAMRFDSQTADTKLVWAMEQHTDAQNKLAPLKARCDELDQTLQAAQTRIDKNRRLSGVCENEMMRIMADYSRTEEALDASNELREELENRRLEVFTFQEQEALVLEARERTLTSDLAALKSRYEELSALIPSLAATEAEAATLDAKVKPGAAEQADDDKLAEEQSALASATNRLVLVSKIRCDQEELALRASRQLESETAAWDAKRIDLLSKLAEVNVVVATHINFCKACESKRDAAAKKVANLDKTIKVVEIRHNSIVSNMAELKIKITQTREATAFAKATAESANCLRISTETECQVETDNFAVWQQIAIGETERLPGMTARILVKNVTTAESHALWSTALTEVQRPYAMALSDVNNGQVKIDNYNQLIAKLSRLRDVAFTLDSRSKVPREGLVSGAPGGNNATAGELYGVHCAVDRFQRSVAEGNTSRIQ
jgi:chromosome segregation ATPase